MRQAYWQYIKNIVDYSVEDNTTERKFKQNKFWSFIKNMRKDAAREILSVMPLTSYIHSMAQIDISTSGVKQLFYNLKPHKASGPDSIPPMIVKELGNEIAPILQIIFQISLTTGQVAYRTTGN